MRWPDLARVDSPNGVYRVCGSSDAYLQAIAWAIRADTAVYSSLYCPIWAARRDRTRFPVGLPVSAFHAVEQAATMVDRFDRMFMRALRQLRDLRRYMSSIVVQRAEQVNVGQQQVNVTAGKDVCDGQV